ncbi:hypothetical protein K435DRAFT_783042 [Dendrothele bispora CBS 962.96]|uniref:Uncharacterized protein n=1 Tax=Dendrothele bispora (strain CBS 962.96) TaxID=1314807 RepID=A0A4S8LB62_DENBC|nr:hypothetical protein K435DRAFT_783042 [Dendrothele bispora CBS 962.96]
MLNVLSLLPVNLAGAILSSFAFGIFFVLWVTAITLMCNQLINSMDLGPSLNRRPSSLAIIRAAIKRPLFLALIALFCINTAYWICIVIRMFKAFGDIPRATWPLEFLADITDMTMVLYNCFLGLALFIGDAIVVYRLSILWRHNLMVTVPAILMLVGGIVIMIGTAVEFTQMSGEDIFNENLVRWLSCSAVLTFCTNGYCAALIAWRIRQFQKDTSEGMKGRLYKATAIFIESAALYMLWALAYLISYETQTNLQTAIVDLGPACAGIACTMISIRVGMGRDKVYLATDSLVNVQGMTHTETLSLPQFSPNRNVFTTTTSSSSSSESDSGISIDPEIIDASSGTASDGITFPKKEESHNVSDIV